MESTPINDHESVADAEQPVEQIRVLHVDDEPDFSELVSIFLTRADDRFEIVQATSASLGMDQLSEQSFDCIVSDYDMPGCDGIEFLEQVRDDFPELPFILFTGKGTEEIASEAISAGVNDYMQKESGNDQYAVLGQRIRNLVTKHRSRVEKQEADMRAETTLEASFDAIVVTDDEGRSIEVNRNACDLFGLEKDELLGRSMENFLPNDHEFAAPWHQFVDSARDTETFQIVRDDGDKRDIEYASTANVVDGEHLSVLRDVTDGDNREDVLREMYNIISNRDQPFEAQVTALLELGREELDVAYGTLSEIQGDEYIFKVVSADDERIQAGDVVPVAATNCEIAASTEQTLVLGDIERDAPEETDRAGYSDWGISCYLGAPVYTDTDVYGTFCFYDTEARGGQFSEWEVTLVDLMSRWVSYELQRQQATVSLRKQNEKLEQYASIVSHDLRNPLGVLEGSLQLAEENGDQENFQRCYRAIERMNTLIDDLLTLARAGRMIDETESVSLASLVEECWHGVNVGDGTLQVELDSSTEIQADRSRLQQLFGNLIRNVFDHGNDDSTVTVGALADGFYLADDGPGIPEENRTKVFESGYSMSQNGTGFGLSIVKEIVEAHGWDIHVTAAETGGARFEVTGGELSR